ncbi:MAG: hypothetical protein CMP10_01530 [Zetaproteobacteria bacterium]|nr:hypothetical protein [Pseudobdellovibrionaceae bacterium]
MGNNRWLNAIMVILSFAFSASIVGAESYGTIVLNDQSDNMDISSFVGIHKDDKQTLTIQDVSSPSFNLFKKTDKKNPSLGNYSGIAWLRFNIENPTENDKSYILVLNNLVMGLDFYHRTQGTNAPFKEGYFGRNYAGKESGIFKGRMGAINVTIPAESTTEFYLAIESDAVVTVKLGLSTLESYHQHERFEEGFTGFYLGIMVIMICYNLFIFLSTRDISYIYYVGTVFGIHLNTFYGAYTGTSYLSYSFEFMGPPSIMIGKFIGAFCLVQFGRHFLDTKNRNKFVDRSLFVLGILSLGCLLLLLAPEKLHLSKVNGLNNLIILPSMLILVCYSGNLVARRVREARYYFIAWLPLITASVTVVVVNGSGMGDKIPNVFIFLIFSGMIEVLLLSLALADRINLMRIRQQQEEQEHREQIGKLNASLEIRVEEQTRDIRSMLESTKVGLFSVTKELVLHKDYARHLETLLQQEELEGQKFYDLVLSKAEITEDEKNKIVTAIEYTIGEDDMFFEVNADCFPREMKIQMADGEIKHMDIDWSPVVDNDDVVEKILVSLRDMTETINLRSQAEEGKRELRYLGEVLEVGPERFQEFDQSVVAAMKFINDTIAKNANNKNFGGDELRKVYIELHTIKGVSRFCGFSDLTEKIHLAEELVTNRKKLDSEEFAKLKESAADIDSIHDLYHKAIAPVFKIQEQLSATAKLEPHDLNRLVTNMENTANKLATEIGKYGCEFTSDVPEGTVVSERFYNSLSKAFVHLLRNSIDHGIEAKEQRETMGKPAKGQLRMFIDEQGRLSYEDDGRGINLSAIKEKAASKGIDIPKTSEEIAGLIFENGFTTKEEASDISGRGVGMDAVREFMKSVGSDITIVKKKQNDDYLQVYFAFEVPPEAIVKGLKKAA